jgi:hypothetical protein
VTALVRGFIKTEINRVADLLVVRLCRQTQSPRTDIFPMPAVRPQDSRRSPMKVQLVQDAWRRLTKGYDDHGEQNAQALDNSKTATERVMNIVVRERLSATGQARPLA